MSIFKRNRAPEPMPSERDAAQDATVETSAVEPVREGNVVGLSVGFGGDGWFYPIGDDGLLDRQHKVIWVTENEEGDQGHYAYAEPHHADHNSYFQTKHQLGAEQILEPTSEVQR